MSGSGAGPYTVRWVADGTATVSVLVSQNGCSDSSTFNVRIYPIPTSAFSIPPEWLTIRCQFPTRECERCRHLYLELRQRFGTRRKWFRAL